MRRLTAFFFIVAVLGQVGGGVAQLTPTPLAQALAQAQHFNGTKNADWTPFEQTFEDGVPMVLVPAGCFQMGSDPQAWYWDAERSTVVEGVPDGGQQCFEVPFWIDKFEVSQGDFDRLGGEKARDNYFSGETLPVEQITWFEAQAFCELRGMRLPTEREWEYAARGVESLVYPWGNDFVGENTNSCNKNCRYDWRDINVDDGYAITSPVGSYVNGASWVGAMDLSGNVWEWVLSEYKGYPYEGSDGREENLSSTSVLRGLRGGSWRLNATDIRSAYRSLSTPGSGDNGIGARCVRSQTVITSMPLEEALERARSFNGTTNTDWTPFEQTFEDGVPRVLVPAGCFQMGSEDTEPDETPAHEQCFEVPFWIDKFEVTQADFDRLGGKKANAHRFSGEALPVEQITWAEAQAFCELRGMRLPTEREWEYAARGVDSLAYPWGNDFVGENVVYRDNSNDRTAPVGSRPGGVSWVGAMDLSGNVWEWVLSEYAPYPYVPDDERETTSLEPDDERGIRGGSWDVSPDDLRAADRLTYLANRSYEDIGWRCAGTLD